MGLRIAGVVNDSIVDGPGLRFTVFVQGCPHNCPGCHNPETHDFEGGREVLTEELLSKVKANPLLSGVTLSGGEPFAQAEELIAFARAVRQRGLSIWAYSGYTFEELVNMGGARLSLLTLCDVLVDGRFVLGRRNLSLPFRGSENQRILNVAASLQAGRGVWEGRYAPENAEREGQGAE